MKIKRMFFIVFAICALASCTSDDLKNTIDQTNNNEKGNVDIELVKMGYSTSDETTRTLVTSDDFSSRIYNTVWKKNENIGLFKLSPNYVGNTQIPLSNASGTSSGSAENDLFKFLSPGDKIVAYYPYSYKVSSHESIPYTFENQIQDTVNSYADMAYNDYLYSKEVVCDGNQQSIPMYHFGAAVKLNIKLPAAGSWKSIIIKTADGNKYIPYKGTYNATNGKITSSEKATHVTLNLRSVYTDKANETVSFYVCLPPMSSHQYEVVACMSDDVVYRDYFTSSFVNGRAYTINLRKMSITNGLVDMGLSVFWSSCNLGAYSTTDMGSYYAWAEKSEKMEYTWYSYTDFAGMDQYNNPKFTKYYCDFSSYCNNFSIRDDAARDRLGDGWRVPTKEEFMELINNSFITQKYVEYSNGKRVYGFLFNSNKTGNSIFLPVTGYAKDTKIYNKDPYDMSVQSKGFYWSSTMCDSPSSQYKSYCMRFGNSYYIGYNGSLEEPNIEAQDKYLGLAIRPVKD